MDGWMISFTLTVLGTAERMEMKQVLLQASRFFAILLVLPRSLTICEQHSPPQRIQHIFHYPPCGIGDLSSAALQFLGRVRLVVVFIASLAFMVCKRAVTK